MPKEERIEASGYFIYLVDILVSFRATFVFITPGMKGCFIIFKLRVLRISS